MKKEYQNKIYQDLIDKINDCGKHSCSRCINFYKNDLSCLSSNGFDDGFKQLTIKNILENKNNMNKSTLKILWKMNPSYYRYFKINKILNK
ncbi:MAG: hypothetical protein ACOCVF_03165 [bacterium]